MHVKKLVESCYLSFQCAEKILINFCPQTLIIVILCIVQNAAACICTNTVRTLKAYQPCFSGKLLF